MFDGLNPAALFVLTLLNLPLFLWLGRRFFGGWDGFWAAVKFWITPDVISLFRGEYWNDWEAEMYLGFYIILCCVLVAGEYWLLSQVLGLVTT